MLSFGNADASFRTVATAWAEWLDDWLAYQKNFGTGPDERIQAAHLMTFYAHHLGAVAGHLFLASGDVVDLSPESLHVRFEAFDPMEGRPEAARRFHFRSLHSAAPGSEDALHDNLVHSLLPAVEVLGRRCGLSAGSLRRLASDGIFGAFVDVGRALNEEDRATAVGLAIVEKQGSPFRSGAPRLERIVGCDGEERVYRIRSGCCLAYRAGEGRHCDVCVLLSPEERRRRLAALAG
ncbi:MULTISPECIES: ferric iron reductase [unclassified Rhizobium]|uniref:ferric iron reductase n=1 Tax=unclassified Rhizobium TaxID=2613769 RepID=UPI000AFE54AA|nr:MULTISPECIES: ferric iron reductase [unclassified Rhizobium]